VSKSDVKHKERYRNFVRKLHRKRKVSEHKTVWTRNIIKETCVNGRLSCFKVRSNGSRSQWPRGLRRRSAAARLLSFGFCLSVVNVVCCQVEVSVTS
jgi:hypothetical protein